MRCVSSPIAILAALAGAVVVASGCKSQDELPPLPEVLVVVDTNLPVTLAASRLRIDLFSEDGTWFESSDIARPTAADWPASFSVYSDDESRAKNVWVRLRTYAEGRQTDYRGERFRDWDAPFADVPGDGSPRLFKSGVDVTPATEPPALLTVDRLLLVQLTPEERGSVRVLLDGTCMGTMSRLGPRGLPEAGAETCINEVKTRVPVVVSPRAPDLSIGGPSVSGTYALDACASGDGTEDRICIDGGGTVLGINSISDYTPGVVGSLPPMPARFFAVSKFLIDKDEVTVGRYRTAIGLTWRGPLPAPNEGPLVPSSNDPNGSCTWSDVQLDREGYALNCIDWEAARIFCQKEGGDLPTELQWEHAATVAGRRAKTRYPWGDELPTCERAVYGRKAGTPDPVSCVKKGEGPAPYRDSENDVSILGVVAQGAGLSEWTLDDPEPYTAKCWAGAEAKDPTCFTQAATMRVVRGGSWASPPARGTFRFVATALDSGAGLGFRCVYPVGAR